MARKKKQPSESAPTTDSQGVGEVYCSLCQGMVNGNGCDLPACPVEVPDNGPEL